MLIKLERIFSNCSLGCHDEILCMYDNEFGFGLTLLGVVDHAFLYCTNMKTTKNNNSRLFKVVIDVSRSQMSELVYKNL